MNMNEERKEILDISKAIENIFQRSRKLSDENFDKFLCNVELIKKNLIQSKRRSKSELIETKTFRDFID